MSIAELSAERLKGFSDAVFAVVITLLVLELRPPHTDDFAALLELWPSGVAYFVSYLFLAIVWVNHHHLMRYAPLATPRLIWANFAHLFSASLVPFTTAWIADTHLGRAPVFLYALVFVLVNATYLVLCMEGIDRQDAGVVPPDVRKTMRRRSVLTLILFGAAAVIALWLPVGGLLLICACLVMYVRPDVRSRAIG
ncbi:MAG TPA: TMEM175 family protein [Rhodanobacteraceae bacterium]|nr:TMEM175 family protein [Rhodanobacteraceae bacterium]